MTGWSSAEVVRRRALEAEPTRDLRQEIHEVDPEHAGVVVVHRVAVVEVLLLPRLLFAPESDPELASDGLGTLADAAVVADKRQLALAIGPDLGEGHAVADFAPLLVQKTGATVRHRDDPSRLGSGLASSAAETRREGTAVPKENQSLGDVEGGPVGEGHDVLGRIAADDHALKHRRGVVAGPVGLAGGRDAVLVEQAVDRADHEAKLRVLHDVRPAVDADAVGLLLGQGLNDEPERQGGQLGGVGEFPDHVAEVDPLADVANSFLQPVGRVVEAVNQPLAESARVHGLDAGVEVSAEFRPGPLDGREGLLVGSDLNATNGTDRTDSARDPQHVGEAVPEDLAVERGGRDVAWVPADRQAHELARGQDSAAVVEQPPAVRLERQVREHEGVNRHPASLVHLLGDRGHGLLVAVVAAYGEHDIHLLGDEVLSHGLGIVELSSPNDAIGHDVVIGDEFDPRVTAQGGFELVELLDPLHVLKDLAESPEKTDSHLLSRNQRDVRQAFLDESWHRDCSHLCDSFCGCG